MITWTSIIIVFVIMAIFGIVGEIYLQRKGRNLPFTDPTLPTLEDDAARLAGMQNGTGI